MKNIKSMACLTLTALLVLFTLVSCGRIDIVAFAENIPLAGGITWSNHQQAVDVGAQGTYDSGYSNVPMVIKDAGLYKMWYMGTGEEILDLTILYCESDDGIEWRDFQLSVEADSQGIYDTKFVYKPMVINEQGYGKMWYQGSDDTTSRLIYCESF